MDQNEIFQLRIEFFTFLILKILSKRKELLYF